jgi:hypothetical protein
VSNCVGIMDDALLLSFGSLDGSLG